MRIARFVHPASSTAAAGVAWGVVEGPAERRATRSRSPRSTGTRSRRSPSPAIAGRWPTCGCWRRSCRARWSRSARTTSTTSKRWATRTPEAPMLFLKPSTSVIGDGDYIRLPPDTNEVHHEAELAAVIGRPARDVEPSDALSHVFGYTAANDVSARDQQRADVQWARAKGHDSFCPLGPWIETVLDPSDLRVTARVNGVLRQDSRTSLHDPQPARADRVHVGGDDAAARRRDPHRHAGRRRADRRRRRRRHRDRGHRRAVEPGARASDAERRSTGAGAVLPVADRQPARRADPHLPVQLGLRPPRRRHLRLPGRGHRRRARLRGELPGTARRAALARPGLGRGARGRRTRTRPTGRASAARSTPTSSPGCAPPATCTSRSPTPKRSRPGTGPPAATRSSATTTSTAT